MGSEWCGRSVGCGVVVHEVIGEGDVVSGVVFVRNRSSLGRGHELSRRLIRFREVVMRGSQRRGSWGRSESVVGIGSAASAGEGDSFTSSTS